HLHAKTQRKERAGIGADAEERDVPERKLAGVSEQQVQAHRGDDEDAGHDQDVQQVRVAYPQRNRSEREDARDRNDPGDHPILSLRANRPVGRKSRITMMITKPIASRYPEEM